MASTTYVLVQSGLLIAEGLLFVIVWHLLGLEGNLKGFGAAIFVAGAATSLNTFVLTIFCWYYKIPTSELISLISASFFATCIAWVLRELWVLVVESLALRRKA